MRVELKKLGLTDKEIEIYLAGLKAGPLSVQKLAEIAKVKRPTAYEVLSRLKELNLATQNLKGKKRFFEMATPQKLLRFAEEKKEDALEMEKNVLKIISNLEAMAGKTDLATDVKIYEGWDGIDEVMVMFAKTDAPFYSIYSSYYLNGLDAKTLERIGKTVLKINEARLGLKNKLYVITDYSETSAKLHLLGKTGIREFRWLPESARLPAMVDVCEDKVALSSIKEKDKYGCILIQNSIIAETLKFMHGVIWQGLEGKNLPSHQNAYV